MRRAAPVLALVLALIAILAAQLWKIEPQAPIGAATRPTLPERESGASAEVDSVAFGGAPFADEQAGESRDAALAAPISDAAGGYRLRLDGPPEWRDGIALGMVWALEPDGRALQTAELSDAAGRADFPLMQSALPTAWYWADLAFPTLGLAAARVPVEGGEVVLPMVLPAYIELQVVDPAGAVDTTFVDVRVPAAREPGNRWHSYRLERDVDGNGNALLMVEAGIQVELRVHARSGRLVESLVQAPNEPEARLACRLEFDAEGVISVPLLGPELAPLAGLPVRLLRCDRWQELRDCTRSDDQGHIRFWPPEELRGGWQADLMVVVERDGVELAAPLPLDHVALREGGTLGPVTLQPAPELVAGRTIDNRQRANAGVVVHLEVGLMLPGKHADAAGLTWRHVAQRQSGDDGTFVFHGLLPSGLPIRLRLPAIWDGRVFEVVRGQRGVELEARRRLGPFGVGRR